MFYILVYIWKYEILVCYLGERSLPHWHWANHRPEALVSLLPQGSLMAPQSILLSSVIMMAFWYEFIFHCFHKLSPLPQQDLHQLTINFQITINSYSVNGVESKKITIAYYFVKTAVTPNCCLESFLVILLSFALKQKVEIQLLDSTWLSCLKVLENRAAPSDGIHRTLLC